MMEDSDILTLGWGCEPSAHLWPSSEEFVTLDVEGSTKESHEYATLEVAKERDRQYFNSCVETEKLQVSMRTKQRKKIQPIFFLFELN